MSIALEMRGVAKRFVAGSKGCLATCHVLRGIDLALYPGQGVAIVGPRGSGKSTLLLCAAGLMAPDVGGISWFGERSRSAALEIACYYASVADFEIMRSSRERAGAARVHLVDLSSVGERLELIGGWLRDRRDVGDAVVTAVESECFADALGLRAIALCHGRLAAPSDERVRARVAESDQRFTSRGRDDRTRHSDDRSRVSNV